MPEILSHSAMIEGDATNGVTKGARLISYNTFMPIAEFTVDLTAQELAALENAPPEEQARKIRIYKES